MPKPRLSSPIIDITDTYFRRELFLILSKCISTKESKVKVQYMSYTNSSLPMVYMVSKYWVFYLQDSKINTSEITF